MKKLALALTLALGLVACGSDDDDDGGGNTGFPRPAGTVALNFSVDDTQNKVYSQGELAWKGAMTYNTGTRIATFDAGWAGGVATAYPELYDDGPWNTGGHEPAGAVAGDNKWGVTVFITPPAAGSTTIGYGLVDKVYAALPGGDGWAWISQKFVQIDNGSVSVAAGATADVTATGRTFPKFGTVDLRVKIDTNNLAAGTWDTTSVKIKSPIFGWNTVTLTNPTAGVFTFTLSDVVGAGKTFVNSGLLNAGDQPNFAFVFGSAEYKATTGVSAEYKVGAGAFTALAGTSIVNSTAGGNIQFNLP